MKESLAQKLKLEIDRIDEKCEQLIKHISLYKDNNDYENAMKNDIKYRQLKIVSQELKKIL